MSAWIERHGAWAIPIALTAAALSESFIGWVARCC
jgi:hypothetical protein